VDSAALAAAVAGRRPDVMARNVAGAIAVVARVRAEAVIVAGTNARARKRMHRPVPVAGRSRMYTCVSPPIRSYSAIPTGQRWMATGSRQRARAAMVVAHPPGRINTRHMPVRVRHGKSRARIAARKCRPCWTATSATILKPGKSS